MGPLLAKHNPARVTSAELCNAADLLARLAYADLERLAAPLRPALAVGDAQWPTIVLLRLIDAEFERRRHA